MKRIWSPTCNRLNYCFCCCCCSTNDEENGREKDKNCCISFASLTLFCINFKDFHDNCFCLSLLSPSHSSMLSQEGTLEKTLKARTRGSTVNVAIKRNKILARISNLRRLSLSLSLPPALNAQTNAVRVSVQNQDHHGK